MRERLVTQRPTVWRYQADARAALASYQQVARSRKGQVVLWACPSDSGAGGVLQGLAGLLGQATPRPMVVGGSFAGGQYVPWPAPRPSKVPLEELAGVVSKVVELAAPAVTAAVGAPWLASAGKLLGQLAEVSGAVRELLETHAGQGRPVPLDPDGLKALLRRAALERPVMCLLEDLDQVESRQAWWSAFLRPLAAEAVRDLPLLLVVSLTGPHELGGHEREEPQPLFVARRLVEAGLASWRWLQPLTVADVAAWLRPCAPSLAAGLHTATSGDPRWLAALWEDWQARRVVRQAPEGTWEFAGPDAARLGRVNDLLDARLARLLGTGEPGPLETARELLATAALEGRRFTAPALAGALGRDPDELIDFLDEHLTVGDDHPDGLVVDVGFLKLHDPEGEPRFVSRYEFVSALHWQTLRRYGLGPSEEAERSERYGWALAEVYAPEPARVVPLIAPLLRAAGKRRAAADFDRRADFDTTLAAQRRHALAVLNMPTDAWDQWDYVQATALLLRAAEAMVYACPPRETLAVYEGAAALAQRADLRPERVTALLGRGYLHLLLGEYVQAGQILGVTHKLARELGERSSTVTAAHHLGHLKLDLDELPAARRLFEEALDGARHLGERDSAALYLQDLARVDREEGDLASARQKANEALNVLRHLRGHEHQAAYVWSELAQVDHDEGDLSAAQEKAREALRRWQETGDRVAESRQWRFLGMLARKRGELEAAGDHLGRALTMQQQLGDLGRQAETFKELAILAMLHGELAEARGRLVCALRLAQRFDGRECEASIWKTLADLAVELGRPSASATLRATSVLLYRPLQTAEAARFVEDGYQQLQALARQDPAAGDADALLAVAEHAYGQDRGWGSVEAAFGPLDDLEPELEPAADQPPSGPPHAGRDGGPADTQAPRTW